MKIKIRGKTYRSIGNELGYFTSSSFLKKKIYYFKGYPTLALEECEIIEVTEAHVNSFKSETMMGEALDKNRSYFQGIEVKKGEGIVINQDWELILKKGIRCESIELLLGSNRDEIRKVLGNEHTMQYQRESNDDSYISFQNTDTSFRLAYLKGKLAEIEFLHGLLRIGQINIVGEKRKMNLVLSDLRSLGLEFQKADEDYGWVSKNEQISLLSSLDLGGDEDYCDYFYMSTSEVSGEK